MSKCRVCSLDLFKDPLMQFENMPKSAQFLPDADLLKNDKGIELAVYQCSGCGLVQITNEPVHYYKEVIRAVAISDDMKAFRYKQFNDFVEKFSLHNEKIIEIGCGCGEYLSIMNEFNYDVYGLEYSDESLNQCRKNGLNVTKGFIDSTNYNLAEAPFNAFYMLSFLEHIPDINSTLRGLYNNLTEDGIGLVEVPNFDMILQKNLFSEFITDHLFYFTKETLNATLSLNGFEIIESNEIWHNYIISATVKKRKATDISHFSTFQDKIKSEIEEYIEQFEDKKVAVWGAGHQALAVMSLCNLSDKLKYVIDSAPFKQEKYTPATHIPIVSPELLNTDPVDAIIIISGSYSDEVSKIIQNNFDPNINIAVLRDYGLEIF